MRKRVPEKEVVAAGSCPLHWDLTWTLEERPCVWSHGRAAVAGVVEEEAGPWQERGSKRNRPWLLKLALSVGT